VRLSSVPVRSSGALTGIGWLFIPALIIRRPFHHQTSSALSPAAALRQRAPWPTLGAALLCLLSGARPVEHRQQIAQNHSASVRSLAFDEPTIDRPTCFRKMVRSALLTFPERFARVDYGERQLEMTTVILASRSTWKMRQFFRFVDLV